MGLYGEAKNPATKYSRFLASRTFHSLQFSLSPQNHRQVFHCTAFKRADTGQFDWFRHFCHLSLREIAAEDVVLPNPSFDFVLQFGV